MIAGGGVIFALPYVTGRILRLSALCPRVSRTPSCVNRLWKCIHGTSLVPLPRLPFRSIPMAHIVLVCVLCRRLVGYSLTFYQSKTKWVHAMGTCKLPFLLEIPVVIRSYKHKAITPRLPKLKDLKKTPRYTQFSEDEENEEIASVIRPERSPKIKPFGDR